MCGFDTWMRYVSATPGISDAVEQLRNAMVFRWVIRQIIYDICFVGEVLPQEAFGFGQLMVVFAEVDLRAFIGCSFPAVALA